MSTDATITAQMTTALKRNPMNDLRSAITNMMRSEDALMAVHRAAEDEVHRTQWQHVKNLTEAGTTPTEALAVVVQTTTRQIIVTGADDTWSGRGNDYKRVRFDALRQWVEATSYLLEG